MNPSGSRRRASKVFAGCLLIVVCFVPSERFPMALIDAWFFYELNPPASFTPTFTEADICQAFGATSATVLGRGSFGETWRLNVDGGGDTAAKIILQDDYDPDRLAREVDGLYRISSGNVVRLVETRTVNLSCGVRAALMCEFVAGGDVAGALAADKWPTYDEAHAFAVGLLTGVVAMHSTETVHRDIKPENIALRGGDWSQPVLLDLGLSKMLDVDSLTTYPALLGTRPFMAPEQIRLQEARKGADIWAVGVVLYLLLKKKHPFYGPKTARVNIDDAVKLVTAGPPDLPADVPEPLRTVATRLLNAVSNQRGSAQRALNDLSNPDKTGEECDE